MLPSSRRTALKFLGAAATAFIAPIKTVFANVPKTVAPQQSLLTTVQSAIDKISTDEIAAALDGTYAKIFTRRRSTKQVESTVHVRYLGPVELQPPDQVATLYSAAGQRFIWNHTTTEVGMGFGVVADDDLRAADDGAILGLAELKVDGSAKPWRLSDLPIAMKTLMEAFRQKREIDAAEVFNQAGTYDPTVGADGVSMVSGRHPHDKGYWSNAFNLDLNQSSFKAALARIETDWVDDEGIKIVGRGKLLVVPSALDDIAAQLDFPYVVWPALTNWHSWFILTNNLQGLPWFERDPFKIEIWKDNVTDMIMVRGYERRCFGCHDPRAVFGSMPPPV